MVQPVKTGLPALKAPLEWATRAGDTVYTTLVAMRPDGSVETGSIEAQTRVTLENLKMVCEAAGGSMADVAQVQVFLTDPADYAGMNAEYAKHFSAPYPNRATIYISGLAIPGLRIEIVAQARIPAR
jgi:enamine deaminase RidA (YjgF/YER057c/UK114 family)